MSRSADAPVASWTRYVVWGIAILLACVGIGVRFAGLAGRPLAVDEYYFLVSIESILADGLPNLPGGGYYVRGILIQYLTAGAVAVTGDTMLGLRIVPTLFGLGCVALGFVYGSLVGDRRVGVGLAFLLLLSSWHVEFSRFGRMYAPLQFFTLLFFIGHCWTVDGRGGWRRYVAPMAVLFGIGTHRLALLLVPLLFIPILLPCRAARFGGRKAMVVFGLVGLTVAGISLLQFVAVQDLRVLGVEAAMPADYEPTPPPSGQSGSLVVPAFAFWRVADSQLMNLAVVLSATVAAALLVGFRRFRGGVQPVYLLVGAAVGAAAFQQLSLAGLLLLLLAFQYGGRLRRERSRVALLGVAATVSIAVVWLGFVTLSTYVWGNRLWITRADETVFRWAVHRTFFGWPDLYTPTLAPWVDAAPILTALLIPAVLLSAWWGAGRPIARSVRLPGFHLLYMAVLFGVLSQQYYSARYWFFLYPLVLTVLLLAGREAGERIGRTTAWAGARAETFGLLAAVSLFSLTDDFNPRHLANLTTDQVGYRTGAFERYEQLWYGRNDVRSPVQFLNERLRSAGEEVGVIVVDVPQLSYYLDRSHAVFYTRDNDRFANVSRERGTVDLWSGQRLISTEDEMREYARDYSEVWILRSAEWVPPIFDVDEVWGERLESQERLYIGTDGFVEVLRLELRESS